MNGGAGGRPPTPSAGAPGARHAQRSRTRKRRRLMPPTPRAVRRKAYEVPSRLDAIDDDLDELEETLAGMRADLAAHTKDQREQLSKILWTLVSILVAVVTACIMLVVTRATG